MIKARPPFVRGDIVTTKDNSREILVTGYGNDPEIESQIKHANQPGEVNQVVNGYYTDDEKKAEHWWHEHDLKFVRSG